MKLPQLLDNLHSPRPVYTVKLNCQYCELSWSGCYDNFHCPKCNSGDSWEALNLMKKELDDILNSQSLNL